MIRSIRDLWFSLEQKERDFLKLGLIIILIVLVCSIVVLPLLLTWDYISFVDYKDTGEIGDTLNGIAAPFIAIFAAALTFLAFYVQFAANQNQKLEYRLAERTANLERFETRFFELIKFQRENVNEMELDEKQGRRVFVTMIREFREAHTLVKKVAGEINMDFGPETMISIAYYAFYIGVGPNSSRTLRETLTHQHPREFVDRLITVLSSSINQDIVKEKRNFEFRPFGGHLSRLGHYYRHLYQTVKYVNDHKDIIDSQEYIRTLRAQLTVHEQALFFINSLNPMGDVWWKENLIIDYRLVKNIPKGFFDSSKEIDITRKFPSNYFEWQEIENANPKKSYMSLTIQDLDKIITSLTSSQKAIEESTTHPDYESKKKSLNEIDEVLSKVRAMKKEQGS